MGTSHKRDSVKAKVVEVRLADLEALEAAGLIIFEYDDAGQLRLRVAPAVAARASHV